MFPETEILTLQQGLFEVLLGFPLLSLINVFINDLEKRAEEIGSE